MLLLLKVNGSTLSWFVLMGARFKKSDLGPDSFMAESESTRRVAWDSAESHDSSPSPMQLDSWMGVWIDTKPGMLPKFTSKSTGLTMKGLLHQLLK